MNKAEEEDTQVLGCGCPLSSTTVHFCCCCVLVVSEPSSDVKGWNWNPRTATTERWYWQHRNRW